MKAKQYTSKRFLAVWILLLLISLSACSQADNVSLDVTTTDGGAPIPTVAGMAKSSEINEKLAALFTPYAEQAQRTADASDGRLSVVYDLSVPDSSGMFGKRYDIHMDISNGTDSLNIVTVHVKSKDNIDIETPEQLDWLDSAPLTESAIVLKHAGMEVDLSNLDEKVGEKFALETFVKLYEAFSGEELDVSDIKVGDAGGDLLKKAFKLNLITAYGHYDYEYADDVYLYNVVTMADVIINDIERDVYGRQSETVTADEFADMLRALYNTCRVPEQDNASYSWAALGEVDFHEVAANMELGEAHEFTRRDGAELVCRITNAGPNFDKTYSDNGLFTVDDSDSIWVRRAVTYGFMDYYGDSVLFAPDEGFTVTNAIRNARSYITCRYNDWSFATGYEWEGIYTKSDILTAAGKTAEYFADRAEEDKHNFETTVVINDRDYDWFFSQKNTGASSSVNCMPAIAAMATHWYNEESTVTVQDMRNTDRTADGWTVNELRAALDTYHVPYTSDIAGIQRFINLLDEGKIILTQYSDRPYSMTGHCYVIYGYKKFNNSVTFIINDADSIVYRTEIFGRPNGNGDEVEANFAMWSINRFYNVVTVVG